MIALTGSLCLSADVAMSGYVKAMIPDGEDKQLA